MSNFKFKGGRKQRPPGGLMRKDQRPVQANITVPLDSLDDIICSSCGGKLFIQTFAMKFLPVIYSPDNKEGTVNALTGPLCVTCGKIGEVKRETAQVRDENLRSAENETKREEFREKLEEENKE